MLRMRVLIEQVKVVLHCHCSYVAMHHNKASLQGGCKRRSFGPRADVLSPLKLHDQNGCDVGEHACMQYGDHVARDEMT